MKSILSLGAGVQSSTLALMIASGEFPKLKVKAAIFADTQAEPQSVYQWLDWLEKQLPFPVYRVTQGSLTLSSLIIRRSKKSGNLYLKTYIPFFVGKHDGSNKGLLIRKCTRDFKIVPIIRKVREIVGREKLLAWRRDKSEAKKPLIRQLIGISEDEAHRMKPSRDPGIMNYYPLVQRGITRQDCIDWMKKREFPEPPRSACIYCPFHSDREWRRLREREPEEFSKAVQFERHVQQQHTIDCDGRQIGQFYLHSSCQPLDKVDFGDDDETEGWGNECEGMCGL